MLGQSDFVVLCVQWTPETEQLIGAARAVGCGAIITHPCMFSIQNH